MKTAWDDYLDQQLTDPSVRQAYEEETKVLSIGLQLANQRKRRGLTQAELAKKIGTSSHRRLGARIALRATGLLLDWIGITELPDCPKMNSSTIE